MPEKAKSRWLTGVFIAVTVGLLIACFVKFGSPEAIADRMHDIVLNVVEVKSLT